MGRACKTHQTNQQPPSVKTKGGFLLLQNNQCLLKYKQHFRRIK
jgi:hypothetical protein